MKMEERFWSNVDKHGPTLRADLGACWLWTASTSVRGYGRLRREGGRSARKIAAHRFSYQLAHGPFPDELHVLHHCDNPRCVNPSHLFLGTHQDNMSDMKTKGRAIGMVGEAHHKAKLTVQQVLEIRDLEGKLSQEKIGLRYHVSQRTVSYILRGEHWKSAN